jgi:hypothetical protein
MSADIAGARRAARIEDIVLGKLARGPLRPFAASWAYAGTEASQRNERQRQALRALSEKGHAVKVAGGWYRITEAGRAVLEAK